MSLESARAELSRLGYRIAEEASDRIVAARARCYWDCLTRAFVIVLVRRVDRLGLDVIQQDEERLLARVRELDTGPLPARLLGVRVVLPIYLAETWAEGVAERCHADPRFHWSRVVAPSVRSSKGEVARLGGPPLWFVALFVKYSFLTRRLLEPDSTPEREPRSKLGIAVLTGLGALLSFAVADLLS